MKSVLNFKDSKSEEANVEVIIILIFCVFTLSINLKFNRLSVPIYIFQA